MAAGKQTTVSREFSQGAHSREGWLNSTGGGLAALDCQHLDLKEGQCGASPGSETANRYRQHRCTDRRSYRKLY